MGYLTTHTSTLKLVRTTVTMNCVFSSISAIYFFTVSIKLSLRLQTHSSPILKRIILLLGLVSFGLLLFVIGGIMECIVIYKTNTPSLFFATWTLYWTGSTIVYTSQLLYFRSPKAIASKNRNGSNTNLHQKKTSSKVVNKSEETRDTPHTILSEEK